MLIPIPVGASLLAKNSSAPRTGWFYASSLATFASKLAPTGRYWYRSSLNLTGRSLCSTKTISCDIAFHWRPCWL
ncbi:hypothetical protein F2A37_19155 [Pseudomonas chlororaphis]|nr:hypothetical protein F2A37_19155 [Pseudomonas chlororaphis]KAB0533689.1 hypothetical protein F7R16_08560 [Pseudomonas chlororaphis subsp. aureofaciens]POA65627.1 hypothetical protein C1888_24535 [Pseudomonas sp. GW531-T4]PWY48202.1 hypothetical protein DK261_09670 [Pseudomonas sp. RW409]TSD26853.1 hypothetical protein FCE86_027350 [Pseudomonas sp. ATCC 13985]